MKAGILHLQAAQPRRPVDLGERLVPMINIIFLLLIFFLVAGHIQAQHGLDLEPPQAMFEPAPQTAPATLQLDRNLNLFLREEPIALDALRERADELRSETGEALVLEVDRDVSAHDLDVLLEVLREAQIDTVRLLIQARAEQ